MEKQVVLIISQLQCWQLDHLPPAANTRPTILFSTTYLTREEAGQLGLDAWL
jgi:hypothetical protein